MGDLPGALAAYSDALDVRRGLAAKEPKSAQWRRALSVGLNKVGDVKLRLGDKDGALAAYEESLAIAASWRRGIIVTARRSATCW